MPDVLVKVIVYLPAAVPFLPPAVLTVSLDVTVVVPFKVSEVGASAQLPFSGAPEQESTAEPVKPPTGVSVTEKVADFPGLMDCDAGEALISKSATRWLSADEVLPE